MKILYDSQIFYMQKFGGISRYFYKIMKNATFEYHLTGKFSDNVYIPEISDIKPFPVRKTFRGRGRIIHILNSLTDRNSIKNDDYDLFHPTYYFPTALPKNKPFILTVHDMTHEMFPEMFADDKCTVQAKRDLVYRASRIIAISENTKKDMMKFYPDLDEAKIDVVYHSVEWLPDDCIKPLKLEKEYILYTGGRELYKNFLRCLKSIAPLLKKHDLYLFCTGRDFSHEEKSVIAELGVSDRVRCRMCTEDELKSLYRGAICFVFPSLSEGFGYPLLEAFASGCPVVCSKASCFPEIAGDASVYFDPYSEDSINCAIEKLVLDSDLRNMNKKKGLERLKLFSEEKFMEGTLKSYSNTLTYSIGGGYRYRVKNVWGFSFRKEALNAA